MEKRILSIDPAAFPASLRPLLEGARVYDSSCSPEARVYYIEKEGGLFLKRAAKGALETESGMTGFFHSKGLAPEVLAYLPEDQDWMLTRAVPGEDGTAARYLSDPKRLCETTAQLLRQLHSLSYAGCPVADRTSRYLDTVKRNKSAGRYDTGLFPPDWGFSSPEEAWSEVMRNGTSLSTDTLLHGDYCLPNVILENWQFRGFIDLGCGGVGDKHIDLFWGAWTLLFNLKTNAYFDRFLDAYGLEAVNPDIFHTIAACEIFG